jgi:hypothetical protein
MNVGDRVSRGGRTVRASFTRAYVSRTTTRPVWKSPWNVAKCQQSRLSVLEAPDSNSRSGCVFSIHYKIHIGSPLTMQYPEIETERNPKDSGGLLKLKMQMSGPE